MKSSRTQRAKRRVVVWLSQARQRLRASLWVVPGTASIAAIALANGLVEVDARTFDPDRRAWFLFGGQAENARELLSTIASSMMTFTALAFSITILGLQLASAQFSPRVLRTFLEDRNTQVALATFVSTFVYAMALLPEVRSAADERAEFVPSLSIFVAFVLVLISVGVFIHYIDHMAHSVRAITIIKRVAAETRESLTHLYPEDVLEGAEPSVNRPEGAPLLVITHEGTAGVLAAVAEGDLIAAAEQAGTVIEVLPTPGDFVPRGAPLFRVWRDIGDQTEKLRSAAIVDEERTTHQDPAFGFRQLVDIAERALSPGVNDPTTAVQVLDELHDLLRSLGNRRFPSPFRLDDGGALRLILPRPGWDGYVRLSLDEIRQYGAGSIQVVRRMRALLEDCMTAVPIERRPILEEQLELLEQATDRAFSSSRERKQARRPNIQGQGGAG